MEATQEQLQYISINKHNFDDWAKRLMDEAPTIDIWQRDQVGEKNEGPYRHAYQNLPLKECGEELVNCGEFGLISKDYYMNKFYDGLLRGDETYLELIKQRKIFPFAWVRKSIATKLQKVDQELRNHDLFLVVNSGWRHPDTQKQAIEKAKASMGEKDTQRLFAKTISPHTTGGAVDVELWSFQTASSLSYSYVGDEYGFYNLEIRHNLNEYEKVKRNIRRILYHLLTKEGLTIHPGEFWHFGDGDPLSAYLNKQVCAKYGVVLPPEQYHMTHFS